MPEASSSAAYPKAGLPGNFEAGFKKKRRAKILVHGFFMWILQFAGPLRVRRPPSPAFVAGPGISTWKKREPGAGSWSCSAEAAAHDL
jgi:hypothetical protein